MNATAGQTGKDVVYASSTSVGGRRFFSVTHDMLGDPFWTVYRRGLKDAAAASAAPSATWLRSSSHLGRCSRT